jgi:exosortase
LPGGRRSIGTRVATRSWVLALAGAGLLGALFGVRGVELSRTWWEDANYSHGFLVPLASGCLAWRWCRRHGLPPRGDLGPGLGWLAAGGVLHLAAVVVWLPPVDFLALAALLYGLARLAGGRTWARGLALPIAFLFFMFPLPAALTEWAAVWLQGVVSALATSLVQLVLPAHRQGFVLHLPGQQLEVGEACSGLRQVLAFAAATVLLAALSKRPLPFKAALVLSAVPVAVAANLLRVLLMVLVLRQCGPQWIGGAWHTAWGLVTVAAGVGLLLGVQAWLGRLLPETGLTAASHELTTAPGTIAADARREPAPPSPSFCNSLPQRLAAAVACLAVTLVGQVALQAHLQAGDLGEPPGLCKALADFPRCVGAWSGQDLPPPALPWDRPADDLLYRGYRRQGPAAGRECRLWLLHRRDGQDRHHHPLICYKVAGYTDEPSGRATLTRPDRPGSVQRFCFTYRGEKSYVYYWHYTFEASVGTETSFFQLIHQRLARRWPSLTLEVFTHAPAPEHLREVDAWVWEVDSQIQAFLPPLARMGSAVVPIRYLGAPRYGPER